MLIVACSLSLIALAGEFLLAWLIHEKADPGSIAILSQLTGTALGALGALLSSTRSVEPKTEISNGPNNPVAVHDANPDPK